MRLLRGREADSESAGAQTTKDSTAKLCPREGGRHHGPRPSNTAYVARAELPGTASTIGRRGPVYRMLADFGESRHTCENRARSPRRAGLAHAARLTRRTCSAKLDGRPGFLELLLERLGLLALDALLDLLGRR